MKFCKTKSQPVTFSKYHGTGNDFIIIDDRSSFFPVENRQLIATLCKFHVGIGADGLVLLQKPSLEGADFRMRIFNSDGSEATMCGNGLSCLTAFAAKTEGEFHKGASFNIQTNAGLMSVHQDGGKITSEWKLPKILKEDLQFDIDGKHFNALLVDSGELHVVVFVEGDLNALNVSLIGREIRNHPLIAPEGANVNFVQYNPQKDSVQVRTYEKGVEQETLACGTGAMAVAYAFFAKKEFPSHVQIDFSLGSMQVTFSKRAKIINHAVFVFSGELNLSLFIK